MSVGLFYNRNQVTAQAVTFVADALKRAGLSVQIFVDETEIDRCDRLVVLGGDGTVLRAAKRAAKRGIPLVGVNYGNLGFLTEFDQTETDALVALVKDESCAEIRRSILEVSLSGKTYYCLNEIALLREISPERPNRVESISVSLNGEEAGHFVADGLIIATPTGSTAYSLSAGGSILTPDSEAFILTPVCAFSLRSRPIVFPDTSVLDFTLAEKDSLMAYGDGIFLGSVGKTDSITVKKSELFARFLTRDRHGFFLRLTEKLN